jgi:hypothetical protein
MGLREVPDIIPFGGHQRPAIHNQLGGKRVIDAMGPDPTAIHWSGRRSRTNTLAVSVSACYALLAP